MDPSDSDMSGKRYGELLLVTPGEAGPQATVYTTFPLNDCPEELWSELDLGAIATETGAATVLLNGPRHWLVNRVEKARKTMAMTKTFGGIDMVLQTTLVLSSMNPTPYTMNPVNQHAVFVFDAGQEIYELQDPRGHRWVMQTWSQTVDPTLTRSDLAGLKSRLTLPTGWTYHSRVLTDSLEVDTSDRSAKALQDELGNTYVQVS